MFDQNEAYYGAAACNHVKSSPTYTSCEFNENTSSYDGGAVYGYDDYAVFDDCQFTFNEATDSFGGAAALVLSDASFSYCAFYMNAANRGGAIVCEEETNLTVNSCSIVENIAVFDGAGMYLWVDSSVSIDQTIIAFNRGGVAIDCGSGSTATLTCSDVSDNDGGDWVDCIAGQESISGNMNVNPLICDIPGYYLYLCADSPCLPGNNDCGELIGVYGDGCAACDSPVESISWGAVKAMYR